MRMSRALKGAIFKGALLFSLAVGFIVLGTLLFAVIRDGLPHLGKTLLTQPPSSDPEIAGARPAILATLYIGVLLLLFVVPIGVGTAVYLEEYADRTKWYNRVLEINIQNLAAVPSIVYGILGLAFLVRGIGIGRVLLAGAMILTLLVLPTVIIAAREAIRSVPDSIRQGGYALGATQWQVVSRQVLPAAIPGIATGSILALSRALGETAPLILIGAAHLRLVRPDDPRPVHGATDPDLPISAAAPGGVQAAGGLRDPRSARGSADAEWIRDLPPQPLPKNMVTMPTHASTTIEPMSLAEIAKGHGDAGVTNREAVFQVRDLAVSYSGNVAIRNVGLDVFKNAITAFIGPSGCGKSTLIRCFNRMNDLVPSAKIEGDVLYHAKDLYADDVDPVEVRRRIGMVFQKPNPFPKSIYDNIAFGPRVLGFKDDLERPRRARPQAGRALGRGQGPLEGECPRPLRRPAAAALHRPLSRGRAGRHPDGRAGLGPRSDLDDADRGSDARAQARVHDRDRHPQHAAGRAGGGHDRVLLGRGRRRRRQAKRHPRRVRPDDEDLHHAGRQAHRGLRDGQVRLVRVSFQEELDELEASLRMEGELVLRSLRGAVEVVVSQDLELADEVIAFDDDIDSQYFEVEQGIELLLARQTPVASDLRLVLAVLKDNLHLERMGDLCVTIAKLTKLTKGLEPDETLLEGFKEMGERAEQMIRVALRSLEQRDRVAAESLLELDELIDRANRRVVNRLLDLGHDLEVREWGLRMILVSRCLERIGDHAVDIGEQTAYLVTGEFREFTDASH